MHSTYTLHKYDDNMLCAMNYADIMLYRMRMFLLLIICRHTHFLQCWPAVTSPNAIQRAE